MRYEYAALRTPCATSTSGKVLDLMDEHDLWKDTMLIVNTDHGFLLGEHDWWAKSRMPLYNEIAHTPLFIWDPRAGRKGERGSALVQTIDFAPTLLEFFGASAAGHAGRTWSARSRPTPPCATAASSGIFGGHVNVTDGRYVYMRGAGTGQRAAVRVHADADPPRAHVRRRRAADDRAAEPFSFTKGCRTMKIAGFPQHVLRDVPHEYGTMLFDLEADHAQEAPLKDAAVERRMIGLLVRHMKENEAPVEQYERLGLDPVNDAGDPA